MENAVLQTSRAGSRGKADGALRRGGSGAVHGGGAVGGARRRAGIGLVAGWSRDRVLSRAGNDAAVLTLKFDAVLYSFPFLLLRLGTLHFFAALVALLRNLNSEEGAWGERRLGTGRGARWYAAKS